MDFLLPVYWYGGRVWHALSIASGSTCISIDGPSMHGNGWWGQVLNVDEAYRARSQAFIRSLFSGVHGNGSAVGRVGGAVRLGHEHGVF